MRNNDNVKGRFPLGGIFRAERNFSLSFLISSTRENKENKEKFRLMENGLYVVDYN